MAVRYGVPLPTNNLKNGTNTKLRLCTQNSANLYSASNGKQQTRAELGRYPLIIKVKKRALQFYNHLKESNPDTLHSIALNHSENLQGCPLSQLAQGLWAQTQAQLPDGKPIGPNQIIRKQKESYLTYWKETTQNQSKMECYQH